jgi:hypothetical protein
MEKFSNHGVSPMQQESRLLPGPTEAELASLPFFDAARRSDQAIYGPLQVAAILHQKLLHERPVFLVMGTKPGSDGYGSSKTTGMIQIFQLLSALLGPVLVCGQPGKDPKKPWVDGCGYRFVRHPDPDDEEDGPGDHCPGCGGSTLSTARWPAYDMRWDGCFAADVPRLDEFMSRTERYSMQHIDEGKSLLFKRDTGTNVNKDFIKTAPLWRKQRSAWGMCLENIWGTDRDLVESTFTDYIECEPVLDPATRKIVGVKAEYFSRTLLTNEMYQKKTWGKPDFRLTWNRNPPAWRELVRRCETLTREGFQKKPNRQSSPLSLALEEDPAWGISDLHTQEWQRMVQATVAQLSP